MIRLELLVRLVDIVYLYLALSVLDHFFWIAATVCCAILKSATVDDARTLIDLVLL
jgi:hypothetical protein